MIRPTAKETTDGIIVAGRVIEHVGLTATGLTGLSPREIRSWVERARASELNGAESAAAILLVYRLWLVGLLLKALGSGWDVAWHFRFIRDDFAPPHNINLLGDGLVIALVLFHWYTRLGVDKRAMRLMVAGIALFVGSAPVDVINHRINGLDITAWSVTHFGLYVGTGIAIAGAIRGWRLHSNGLASRTVVLGGLWFFFLENVLFPSQHQEYGVEEIASWDRNPGHPFAEPELLDFAARLIGEPISRESVVAFSLPVPQWVYPVWIVAAAMLTLVMARRSVGRHLTASTIAFAYVGWRCVLYPILAVADFPTSAVPFLLLAGAIMIDLVCLMRLPGLAEAALGATVVTAATYVGGFIQSYVLVAPPIGYWSAPSAAATLFGCWAATNALRARTRAELF